MSIQHYNLPTHPPLFFPYVYPVNGFGVFFLIGPLITRASFMVQWMCLDPDVRELSRERSTLFMNMRETSTGHTMQKCQTCDVSSNYEWGYKYLCPNQLKKIP